jgi:hypothetical protein
MLKAAVTIAAVLMAGCGVPHIPGLRQVSAIEVDVTRPADRAALIAILHERARLHGLHLDDLSEQWVQLGKGKPVTSPVKKSIYVGLWRTADDKDLLAGVDDGGHLGKAWVTFLAGEQPELADEVRRGLLADIERRWPDARKIPVMPNGALPLDDDLVWTGSSYVVKSERISSYAAPAQ